MTPEIYAGLKLESQYNFIEKLNNHKDKRKNRNVGSKLIFDSVTDAVSKYFELNTSEMVNTSRRLKKFNYPRQICFYFIYDLNIENGTNISYQNLAKKFNRANHATIISGINNIRGFSKVDLTVKEDLKQIKKLIESRI